MRIGFDSGKSSQRQSKLNDDKSSGYCTPVFRTHPYGYNFIIRFHHYGVGIAAGQVVTLIFAFSSGNYDCLLRWPFPKVVHLSLRDQLDPLITWTQLIQPTREPSFGRPTSSLKSYANTS